MIRAAVLLALALATAVPVAAQSRPATGLMGADLFAAGCAGCHGPEGSGAPDSTVGFEKPETFPDFTGCDQTSPEKEADWWAIIHDGGKARGFSRIMPAFGELLTGEQITSLVKYIRGLCQDRRWPPGELNLPRALVTEKAFPENEWVIETSIETTTRDATTTIVYERRVGARGQVEIAVPFAVAHDPLGGAHTGVGDVGAGYKQVLFSNHATIVSVQGEVTASTGNRFLNLGSGTTVVEAFGAVGQRLPADTFIQGQAGVELPVNTALLARAVYGRVAFGRMLRADRGLGRMWTPMLETIVDRAFETGAGVDVDFLPQLQVTLSARQHVRAAFGVQVPATRRDTRATQVVFYLLWDFFDGGMFDGWR